MKTETDPRLPAPRPDAGFSLMEVLIAMVILAVGLLGIEAMAIGASRQIASANRTTEYTLIATEQLENELRRLRTTTQDPQPGYFMVDGARVQVVPEQEAVAGAAGAGGTMWTIAVTVTPPSIVTNVQPITVTARAFE